MKLLFIQGGSRVRKCKNGSFYVDGNFNNDIWKRYKSYCDDLTVILREKSEFYDENDIKDKLNNIDTNLMNLVLVEDVYKPKKNFLNFKLKKKIKKQIESAVIASDKIIIRSIGNFYTNTALKYCKKYNKVYLIEVTGFAFEGLWYHSLYGKVVAIPREIKLRKSIKDAPYAVYVTEKALQKRYPCKGKTLGCSDVELIDMGKNNVIEKINNLNKNGKLKLGTAAFLDVKWKGQKDVIKALHKLKKAGYDNFTYELIGAGNKAYLEGYIEKYNLKENVRILGVKKREEVFEWLKTVDVYVQPSYQEGLCRAIVEAMSMGCPVIASNAGGNAELVSDSMMYKKKNVRELVEILKKIDIDLLKYQSRMNYEKAKLYKKEVLNKKRNRFYMSFTNN